MLALAQHTSTMDRTAIKKAVLKAARARLENTAAELKERITELRSVTLGGEDAETPSQTESLRGSDVELLNSLGEQYNHVLADLARTGAIDASIHPDVVGFGTVVHTDKRDLFVGASLEEFDARGRRYLGVTPRAPLVQALLGRRVGERVTVGNTAYVIEAVF